MRTEFTARQRDEIKRLAGVAHLEELLVYIDRLADARVVAFAQGALLAGSVYDPTADRRDCAVNVVTHLRNTVAQYEALELGKEGI